MKKQKCFNLGSEMPCLSISDQQYCIWVFLDQNFKQNSCHIWNQHPWIGLIAKYHEIMKIPKFGTKSASWGYFWGRIAKTYCHIWNQHPQICLFAKFYQKNKNTQIGEQKCLSCVFLRWNLKTILSHLKSAPLNLPNCKMWRKNKTS